MTKYMERTPKVCRRCGQAKSLNAYKVYKNGRSARCRDCMKEVRAIQRGAAKVVPRGTKNKQVIAKRICNYVKETNGCAICGLTDPVCLLFHHINGQDKLGGVGNMTHRGRINLLLEEMARCVVLCANDHQRVHWGGLVLDPNKKCVVPNIDHLL